MERSEEHRELKGKFTEFLDQDVSLHHLFPQTFPLGRTQYPLWSPSQHGHGEYPHKIREMISREQYRLLVDAGHLRAYDPRLADRFEPRAVLFLCSLISKDMCLMNYLPMNAAFSITQLLLCQPSKKLLTMLLAILTASSLATEKRFTLA